MIHVPFSIVGLLIVENQSLDADDCNTCTSFERRPKLDHCTNGSGLLFFLFFSWFSYFVIRSEKGLWVSISLFIFVDRMSDRGRQRCIRGWRKNGWETSGFRSPLSTSMERWSLRVSVVHWLTKETRMVWNLKINLNKLNSYFYALWSS
jgi:hypothetical protein